MEQLSKKEQIQLRHEAERARLANEERNKKLMKWGIIALIAVLVIVGFWWSIKESSKPLPGQAVKDLGRGHVPETTKVKYNSNPPTSGKHYEVWTKAGFYDKPVADGHLTHSLEHGYIIISYNCDYKVSGKALTAQECSDLKNQLKSLIEEQRVWKLIAIARPNLDAPLALTAWTRIEKLAKYDKEKIVTFINAFRDKGPEQTME